MKRLGATLAALALLTTAACGSSRPSAEDISTALQKGVKSSKGQGGYGGSVKLKKKGADCVAKALEGSKLTDQTLRRLVDKHVYPQSKANDEILQGLAPKITKCSVT